MFFLIERRDLLALHPRYYTRDLPTQILAQLRSKTEGHCSGRYGYCIAVTGISEIGSGRIDEDSGYAHFPVKYLCLVFRPFKNEILLAKVTAVNQNGFFCSAGPLEIFVSEKVLTYTRTVHYTHTALHDYSLHADRQSCLNEASLYLHYVCVIVCVHS